MGFEALDMLRTEAGLILGGNEFSDETDPFEAGIAFYSSLLKQKKQTLLVKKHLLKEKKTLTEN